MKEYVLRTVDEFGRISLPKGMREALGIDERDKVSVELNDGAMVIRKYAKRCIFCGSEADIKEYSGKIVCKACANKLASDFESL